MDARPREACVTALVALAGNEDHEDHADRADRATPAGRSPGPPNSRRRPGR